MDKAKVYVIICHWRDMDGMDEVNTFVHSTLEGARVHFAEFAADEVAWWRNEYEWKIPETALDGASHYYKSIDGEVVEVDCGWDKDCGLWVTVGSDELHLYDTNSYIDTDFYISEQTLGD